MTPIWQFWLDWVVQVATAVGTIAAVVVALFGDWLRTRFAPPKLILKLQNELGIKVDPTILTAPDGSTREAASRWYHVRVENGRRWSSATQVQVFLLRVEEPDAAREYKLMWFGEIPIRWRYQEINPLIRSIGYPADCDLCSVVKGKWLELHPIITPLELTARRREASHLILTLQARGLEGDSNLLRVRIDWDGQWADDTQEMAAHMVVKVASE